MSDIVKRLNSYSDWLVSCALGNVPDEAQMCMDAATEITHLRSELANARNAALEEAEKLIEEGYPRPGITNAHGRCPHGLFGWEDCEQCAVVAIRGLKAEGESR